MVVSTKDQQPAVWEGEALTLLCKVDGAESLLSVTWWHAPQGQTQLEFVAGMEQDGTVQLGTSFADLEMHSNMRLEKMDWATFQLEITSATIRDSGTYECRVSERPRPQARDLSWTQQVSVTVKPLSKCQRNPFLNVRLFIASSCSGMRCSGTCVSS